MMRIALALATLAVGITLAFVATGGRDDAGPALATEFETPRSILAIVGGPKPRLVRVAPTLRILEGHSVRLRSGTPGAAHSADGRWLAVGGAGIWIVDVERMSVVGPVAASDRTRALQPRAGRLGTFEPVAWLRPRRLLAFDRAARSTELLVVDPQKGRVLWRRPLGGEVIARGQRVRGERRLILLLAWQREIGPARVVVVDDGGRVRSVALDRIAAGRMDAAGTRSMRENIPGMAVDGVNRAFVVGAGSLVAEVDLETLAVAYHELSAPGSLLDRLRNWLEPKAHADGVEGPARHASWLGDGRIAVSGEDTELTSAGVRQTPAGLKIIDTGTWKVRTIDERVNQFMVAGNLLLGSSPTLDAATGTHSGTGVVAYTASGERRFHLFDPEPIWRLQTIGRYAYVPRHPRYARTAIVDLVAGEVVREVAGRTPLLVGRPS
jgi:hypothetical protein